MGRTGFLLLGMGLQAIVTGALAITGVVVIDPVVQTVEALLLLICVSLLFWRGGFREGTEARRRSWVGGNVMITGDPRADSPRPSPDALLAAEVRERRAKLKVFLGAAAGVGKTYAMLEAAQSRMREGIDVVAAWSRRTVGAETAGAGGRSGDGPAPARGIQRPRSVRDGHRRHPGAAAPAGSRRRAGAHQRARQSPRQALPGRGRAARRRHQTSTPPSTSNTSRA